MDIEALKTIAKAARLQRDGERLYCTGKTLSDIRPVFGTDPAARPLGTVLTHTLKIAYHQGSERLEFHVILDSTDLEELAEAIRLRARGREEDKAPAARPLTGHTLKIAYHQGSERLEFHVILDSTDLEELAEAIQRAKDKDKALRELLNSTKLPSFDD